MPNLYDALQQKPPVQDPKAQLEAAKLKAQQVGTTAAPQMDMQKPYGAATTSGGGQQMMQASPVSPAAQQWIQAAGNTQNQQASAQTSTGTPPTGTTPPPAAQMSPADAAAKGLGWVPPDHPMYGKPGYVGSQPAASQPTGGTQPNGQIEPSTPPPAGTPPPATAPPPGPQDALKDMFRKSLMDQLGQNTNAISISDADLAPQSQAFRAAMERDTGLARRDAAEQAGAVGLADSGALRARSDKLTQGAALGTAANDAALIGQKQQQRIDQLKSAQAMAMQMGLAEEANKLQTQIADMQNKTTQRGQDITLKLGQLDNDTKTKLADLDAQLQREGYSSQERVARMDQELRRYGIDTQGQLGKGQLSLDFLKTQLQNQQFNDQLGFNIGSTAADLNRQYLMAGLGNG